MGDVDAHIGAGDILITEGADLADAQAGGIHEGDHGFLFEVWHSGDESPSLLLGGDKGKELVKPAHGELGRIPGFMQDVHGKEAELGDGTINGAVGKAAGFLEPADVVAEFVPGYVFRRFVKERIQVDEIRMDIGAIAFQSMSGKAAEGDHLPESI